jgi:hypothetical protein
MLAKVQVTTALIGAALFPTGIAAGLIGDHDRLAGASPAMTACKENRMRRFGTVAIIFLAGAVSVWAAELPPRKAGLWEIKLGSEGHDDASMTVQQCVDAATDQMMMSSAGPVAQACRKRDVQRSGDTITIDSTCALAGKTVTSHIVITGSFDSAYTMTTTRQGNAMPGGKISFAATAKWLGPCPADQNPGDMIMADGKKMNILEMRKFKPSQGGLPQQPPGH